jgi:hypothetical protein
VTNFIGPRGLTRWLVLGRGSKRTRKRGPCGPAPTRPGLEPGDRDRSGLDIPEFVGAAAAAELKRLDWRDVVVVGHSEGSPAPRHG